MPDFRDSQIVKWVRRYRTPGEPDFSVDAAWERFRRERGIEVPRLAPAADRTNGPPASRRRYFEKTATPDRLR